MRCSEKKRYPDRISAELFMLKLVRKARYQRVYKCNICKGWHLTKRDYLEKNRPSVSS